MEQIKSSSSSYSPAEPTTISAAVVAEVSSKRYYRSKYTCFEKFQHTRIAHETKKTYTKYLKDFLKFCHFSQFEQLIEMTDSEKYESIMDYLIHLSIERQLSHTSLMNAYSGIKKFYAINGIKLDWEQICINCLGKKNGYNNNGSNTAVEDRVYTKEEIIQLLDHADLRMKVIILIMLSSGIRVGGLAELKIKDLEYIEKYQIYKINVYSYDSNEKYVTYCTPECASTINKYLEYRKKLGDSIAPDSPLIYMKTSRANGYKKERIEDHYFDKHISSDAIQQSVGRLQRKSQLVLIQSGEKDPTKRA
jgi:site-specific recombinase XerD